MPSYLMLFLILAVAVSAVNIDPKVLEEIEKNGTAKVIIQMNEPSAQQIQRLTLTVNKYQKKTIETAKLKKQAIKISQDSVIKNLTQNEFKPKNQLENSNIISGDITLNGLNKLNLTEIVSIFLDLPIYESLNQSVPFINGNAVHSIELNGINITGKGQTICILDSGIESTHPALSNCNPGNGSNINWSLCQNIDYGWDYSNNDSYPEDDTGHGTHVTGTIISNNSVYKGVAPDAHIIVMKVLSHGTGYTSDEILAIDWCTSNRDAYNISVISMSLGSSQTYNTSCDAEFPSIAQVINNAVAKNISVIVASGNFAFSNSIASPACITNATSVGASSVLSNNVNIITNSGSLLDLIAPGISITSTYIGGGFSTMLGTSMATPHVSGAFALSNQYWQQVYNKTPTPNEILNKFKITGARAYDAKNGMNFSRIDILAALQPYVNFTSSSTANNTNTLNNSVWINITSDVDLTNATLEVTLPNSSKINHSMTQNNATNYQYNLLLNQEGNYTYTAYGNDSILLGASSLMTLTSSSLITVNQPTNNSHHNSAFNLNITLTALTNQNITNSTYNITNSSGFNIQSNANLSINQNSFNWTDLVNISNSTFPDDNYTLNITGETSDGLTENKLITFTVDKTAPLIFAHNITPTNIYRNDTVIIAVNTTDTYLNTSLVYLESNYTGTLTNHTMNLEIGDLYNYTLNATNLTVNANITYSFYSTDFAGNINVSENYSFIVQNYIPYNVTINYTLNLIEVGNSTQFNATVIDLDGDNLTYFWDFNDTTNSSSQNATHTFETTGNFTILLNVSDGYSYNHTTINITVNDTKPPFLRQLSYDTSVHIESEGNQTVEFETFDYSGITLANLTANNTNETTSTCNSNITSWNCSFTWQNFTIGTYQFFLNLTDNLSHTNITTNYTFSVVSCHDGSRNGDETGTDCGGSCSACSVPTSDSDSGSSPSGGSGGGGGGGGGGGAASVAAASAETSSSDSTGNQDSGTAHPATTRTTSQSAADPVIARAENTLTLVKDKVVSLNVEHANLPVKTLSIQSNKDQPVNVKFTSYRAPPQEVKPLTNSYQYFEMTPDVHNDGIENAAITFTVSKQWLQENNYLSETVALNVFEEKKQSWKKIKTQQAVQEDQENLYFEAEIPHFSFYSITASDKLPWYNEALSNKIFIISASAILVLLIITIIILIKHGERKVKKDH